MKTSLNIKNPAANSNGFTLTDLVAVLAMIALLAVVELPVLALSKGETRIGVCASQLRQISLACQLYANENNNLLPVRPANSFSGGWAWDTPVTVVSPLMTYGLTPATFYCPGTAPRFTDWQNWSKPGIAPNSSLWNFGISATPPAATDFRVLGYALTFPGGSSLASTNQNSTILPEPLVLSGVRIPAVPAATRVLVADATISTGMAHPGYLHPENNYTYIDGGFEVNGMPYPHTSPHLKGNLPAGGNLGFKDGHVAWRPFTQMTPRTTSGTVFWW
jgi:type II secretory pathway pseudopilin PulG